MRSITSVTPISPAASSPAPTLAAGHSPEGPGVPRAQLQCDRSRILEVDVRGSPHRHRTNPRRPPGQKGRPRHWEAQPRCQRQYHPSCPNPAEAETRSDPGDRVVPAFAVVRRVPARESKRSSRPRGSHDCSPREPIPVLNLECPVRATVRVGSKAEPRSGSAGINRHGAGDESSLHRRSSDPRWP